jgi:hypothetical protein
MRTIRFKFSPAKARTAIHWMLRQQADLNLHTVLKACYFADKNHLNEHGRPIFGADYKAMKLGPVPLQIYEMAKGEPLWLAELAADKYPWRLDGYRLSLTDNAEPDMDVLSASDIKAISHGFDRSRRMTLDERTAATHGADWKAANLGRMRYEDMLDESPEKAQRVADLRELASHIRL